jgi:acyl dehydratase
MSTTTLKSPPSSGSLYLKAAIGMTPLAGKRGKEMPQRTLRLEDVKVDLGKLADYCRVTGFTMLDTLPPIYPNALAFPLHMALLTANDFPFPAIGLVHVENTITQHRPVKAIEPLTLTVRATPIEPHAKGRQFTVITEVLVGDELTQVAESTYLRRGDTDKQAPTVTGVGGPPAAAAELPTIAEWRLPGDLGRRYAAVSGDRNPIHMHNLSAKAFGFQRAIAHGMWTKARCLAALDNRRPDAFKVHVAFRRPILLPAKVELAGAEHGEGIDFAVRDARKGTPHLDGTIRPL